MERDRTPGAGPPRAQVEAATADTGAELRQAHTAVELVEGLGLGPSVVTMAEHAIETRAYGSAMNVARLWLRNKPHVEYAARSLDPTDPFVARAQSVLDRMRPLEAKLPSHPFSLGVPELDRADRDAWLVQLGEAPAAPKGPRGEVAPTADLGAPDGHGHGTTDDAIDLGDIARGVLVPFWAQNDTVRRTILGADHNPVMDGVDDIAHSLIYDAAYGAGFAVGAARGCGSAIVDCLRGPYDLAKLAAEITAKLALYEHAALLASLRDTIKAVPAAVDLLGKRWNDDSDRRAQGAFQGEVVGYIGTQLAILVITAAANPLAELAGPYAAVIRAIAAVGDPLTAVREVAMGVRLSEEATAALGAVRRGARAEAAATERAVEHVADGAGSAGIVVDDAAASTASTSRSSAASSTASTSRSPAASNATAPASSGGRYGTHNQDEALMDLLTDPSPTPEVEKIQQEASRRHPDDMDRQLDVAHKAQQTLRQSVLASRTQDAEAIASALTAVGITDATPALMNDLARYLFDSAGIAFTYENYAAWSRLSRGAGTVDDVRFIVHEMSEINTLQQSGIDFMGDRFTVNSDRHLAWEGDVFTPAYTSAHERALRAEYQYLADRLYEVSDGKVRVSVEEIAAFDQTRDEARLRLRLGGRPLLDHADFHKWRARGAERITLDPPTRDRIGVGVDVSLAELLSIVKRRPASTLVR